MRHGEELHVIRPDGVYITSVLTAIPGFQPVQNAQDVAARFTAIWQPRVQDALKGAGLGERAPGLVERFRLWRYKRKFQKAIAKRGVHGLYGLGDITRGDPPFATSVPVGQGYQPAFQRQEEVALQLTTQRLGPSALPPVLNPAMSAAAQITPVAYAPEALSQQLVADRVGGMVGARANSMGVFPFASSQAGSFPFWRRSW